MKRLILLLTLLLLIHSTLLADLEEPGTLIPKVKWKFKTKGPVRGTAVIDAERIYFGSTDGALYAVDKANGNLVWRFQTQGSINSTPSTSGSLIIVSSNYNSVYAMNKISGKLEWKFQFQELLPSYWEWDYYTSSPVVSEGKLFVGSGDGNLYALSISDGKLLWKYKTNGRIRATPLVHNGEIYLPSNDGVVYVLAARNGTLLWRFETEGSKLDSRKFGWDRNSIYATPVLQDSILIVASRDGKVYAVNVNTQKEKWHFTYGPTWAMSASIDGGVVFVGWSDNSLLSAIDLQTGKEKWKFQSGSLVYTKPFIHGDEAFIGSADENIYCLNKNTGEKKWEYKTGRSVYSSPVVESSIVFAGSDDGYFYAIEEGRKPIKAVYFPIPKNKMEENIFTVDKKITPYLKERGFEQLDSAMLHRFLIDRIRDQNPSVIVFAYDMIPANIVGENPKEGMIRKYLDGGGKILWFGNTPNLFKFDGEGTLSKDSSIATRMLGVEFIRIEESGNYYGKPTQTGLNWGLPEWLTITFSNVDVKGVTPLAFDEYNRVSAWLKKFSPLPGSGFVSCRTWGWYAPIHDDDLEIIYNLAMHELE